MNTLKTSNLNTSLVNRLNFVEKATKIIERVQEPMVTMVKTKLRNVLDKRPDFKHSRHLKQ